MVSLMIFVTPLTAQLQTDIQHMRPYDQNGVNVFDLYTKDTAEYTGFGVRLGGGFAQQFQMLDHSNDATDEDFQLTEIGPGFNLASANLNIDVQLDEGLRLNLITYLSSRGHSEAWVKGGFIQVDQMKFLNSDAVDNIMKYFSLRVGHMEINYGDAHFRRTDNGNALYNPFVGNYIIDAFTTEIGGELYFYLDGFMAMAAMTNGEIRGQVVRPDDRAPALYAKLAYDKQLNDDLRVRLSASFYNTEKSMSNTLMYGDRAGARYYNVFDNGARTPRFDPMFRDKVTAFAVNPFIKFGGLELFGTYEQFTGRMAINDDNPAVGKERTWTQLAADLLFRFGSTENFYVGGRYNTVSGELHLLDTDASIDRIQLGAGWFITPNILTKIEYVTQTYNDFPEGTYFEGGNFNGIMIEGAISF